MSQMYLCAECAKLHKNVKSLSPATRERKLRCQKWISQAGEVSFRCGQDALFYVSIEG